MKKTDFLSVYELEDEFQLNGWEVESYEYKKHLALLKNGDSLRLPLQLKITNNEIDFLEDYTFMMVVVQSGEAVIGLVEDGELVYHKVFRGYLVRKKQGKSQLNYLKTKGKSRAGSRIRLSSTFSFIEEINEKIAELDNGYNVERVVFYCSDLIKPHLFSAKYGAALGKNDERIFPLSMNVDTPSYDFLERVFEKYSKAELNRYL